jgi:hypothetical protein
VSHYNGHGNGAEVYLPEVKTYSWGKGVTQRRDAYEIEVIAGKVLPVITTYQCVYFGVVSNNIFTMSVSGHEESLEDANQWAAQAGAKAEQTTLGNIGD